MRPLLLILTLAACGTSARAQGCGGQNADATVRAEGDAELVSPTILTCSGVPLGTFDLYALLNNGYLPITSRPNEATVTITDASGASTSYPGMLLAGGGGPGINEAEFTRIGIPNSTFQIAVSGIRVDMFTVPLNTGGYGQALAELSFINAPPGAFPVPSAGGGGSLYVATSVPGLGPVSVSSTSISACSASAGIAPGSVSPIVLSIPEGFPTAFLPQFSTPSQLESESRFPSGAPGVPADSGTQFVVTFDQIAAGVTLYFPLTISSNYAGVAQLVTAEGETTPVTSSTIVAGVPVMALTQPGSIVYNVIASASGFQETFAMPAFIGSAAGTPLPASGAATYRVDLGPRSSVLPSAVPRFTSLAPPGYQAFFNVVACGPLSFNSTAAALGQPQAVTLTGPAGATFTASTSQPWITVTPSTGTLPANLSISVNPAGLTGQSYGGTVQITSIPAGVAPASIPVTLWIAPQPQLTLSPAALTFGSTENYGPQAIAVSGLASGTPFTATAIGAPWLSVAQSGSANSGAVAVSVNSASLAAGQYFGLIQITSGTVSAMAPVSLSVSPEPGLSVSSTALVFNSLAGALPAPQMLVTSASASAVNSSAAWLTAPNDPTNPSSVDVTVNPAGLAAGTYHATLTVSAAPLASIQIPVTLQIGPSPVPLINDVRDAATYLIAPVAPGSIVSIFGLNLGPDPGVPLALNSFGAVSTLLSDTQVSAGGLPCPLVFVSASQINAIIPFELAGQSSTNLQVFAKGMASNLTPIALAASEPGLFTSDASGTGPVAAINQDGSVNSAASPAPASSTVAVFGQGGGPLSLLFGTGAITPLSPPLSTLTIPLTATIGGQPAVITYAGAAPGLVSAVNQINVVIPAGLSPGMQPVVLSSGSQPFGQTASLFVQ